MQRSPTSNDSLAGGATGRGKRGGMFCPLPQTTIFNILHEWTHMHPVLQCPVNLLAMCDKGLSIGRLLGEDLQHE